ncbi:amidase [Microbacterium trichothecenolyticum]|uniref:Glutamyl-tRNA(Gln) amidotransferase subunit A n=1 Tax=Microbacterium trichothecenolyticum TaxID=69370 RepID=A0A0M2H4V2_MICTR|nr:amidase family protein [Microbacterium trichothecenolyticum]KJL41495.1 Glutamyl-tRNA(Gln) amidotransferase subunit A [Microbacterium trichothecenolyticum]
MSQPPPPPLDSATAMAAAVREGELTAQEVVEEHLARIGRIDPGVNALTVVFADRARSAAAEIDAAVKAGRDPGPLAGVPISVKENIDLTWSATTNGWRGLADAVPARDAAVVRRLRDAGAVPVARGNMPDFGMRWDTDNDVFGRTLNPWNRARSAGGSSGGDAVAVATGMSGIGLGNDFGGSLRLPAYAAGVVGLRPSLGRVPRAAVREQPVALTLQQFSVNGPMARRVDDVALALGVMQGWDADDPVSIAAPAVRPDAVPRRVGVVRDPAGLEVDPDVAAGLDRAAASLARAGWEIVDAAGPLLEEAAVLWRRLSCTDMLISLDPAALGLPLGRSATQFLRDSTAAARPYESAREYAQAWARRAVIAAEWRRLQVEVPVILGPVSMSRMREPDYDLGGQEAADRAWRDLWLTVVVNFLGLPALALPTGLGADGMPTGVQLIGPMFGEDVLFEAGRAVEAGVPALPPVPSPF